jgi:Methyltransferase FkbM domain
MFWRSHLLYVTFFLAQLTHAQDLKTLIRNTIPLRADGKIEILSHIKHIKLDIGLSYNAPMSQHWLSHEDDLVVFGFEPNPACATSILQGSTPKRHPAHGNSLEKKFIETKRFFLIPCALGLASNTIAKFFITKDDCGCSSLYMPKYFALNQIIEVPVFSLSDFFDLFPFDTHPVIEYVKIDAQGSDLNIAKSAGLYLAERVVYITLEAENSDYQNTTNSYQDIDNYMKSIGFIRHLSPYTGDPTYLNLRFSDYVKNHKVQIYQQG